MKDLLLRPTLVFSLLLLVSISSAKSSDITYVDQPRTISAQTLSIIDEIDRNSKKIKEKASQKEEEKNKKESHDHEDCFGPSQQNPKLEENHEKVIEEILSLIGKGNHPASFIQIMKEALKDNPAIKEQMPEVASMIEESLSQNSNETRKSSVLGDNKEETLIFISYSLKPQVLEGIFKKNLSRRDVTYVMRGIPKGASLGTGIKKMQDLVRELKPMPNIILDPSLFRAYSITAVPSVARVKVQRPILVPDRKNNRKRHVNPLIGKVTGLDNDRWLKEQIEIRLSKLEGNDEAMDFGVQGEHWDITEPDLVEEMKRRVMAIDWEAKKKKAINHFWEQQQKNYIALPRAEVDEVRYLDPSITVLKDIVDINGNIIRHQGETVNPLEIRAFTQAVLVFNPKQEEEVFFVRRKLRELKASGRFRQVMVLVTEIPEAKRKIQENAQPQHEYDEGWKIYTDLTDFLDTHIFLLTAEVKSRWDIKATPSLITADNAKKMFVIQTFASEVIGAEHEGGVKNEE